MKSSASSRDFMKLMTPSGNDFAYLCDLTAAAGFGESEALALARLQDMDPSNQLVTASDYLEIELVFDEAWSPETHFEDFSVMGVFGLINNNLGNGSTVDIDWYDQDNTLVQADDDWGILGDKWLDRFVPKNDWYVLDSTQRPPIGGDTNYITKVVLKITQNDTGAGIKIGRVWAGDNFEMITTQTTNADPTFDGGWQLTFGGEGYVKRNRDQTVGQPKGAPVIREIIVGKSALSFSQAYGSKTWQPNLEQNVGGSSFFKLAYQISNSGDCVILPNTENYLEMKMTGIYGSLQNQVSITKDPTSRTYSAELVVKELVPEANA